MSEMSHPKFVCRREGHRPEVTVKNTTGVTVGYLTRCARCGASLSVEIDGGGRQRASAIFRGERKG